jgi:hypothetical protein
MKFLFDQSADFRLIAHLQEGGRDVTAISRDHPHSLPDQEVLAIARREQRILLVPLRATQLHRPSNRISYIRNYSRSQLQHAPLGGEASLRSVLVEAGFLNVQVFSGAQSFPFSSFDAYFATIEQGAGSVRRGPGKLDRWLTPLINRMAGIRWRM